MIKFGKYTVWNYIVYKKQKFCNTTVGNYTVGAFIFPVKYSLELYGLWNSGFLHSVKIRSEYLQSRTLRSVHQAIETGSPMAGCCVGEPVFDGARRGLSPNRV